MNVLVTGATGFVGVNLIQELISLGHSIRILVRNSEKAKRIFGDSCDIFIGDVTDKESLRGCCDGMDIVYHMVACVGNDLPSSEAFEKFRAINVVGLQNVIEESKRANVKRFIFISSIAAMGIVKESIISESSKCEPYLPYQVTKREGELRVLKEFQEHGFPAIIVRPTKVYGPGENETTYLMYAKFCKRGVFPKVGAGSNCQSNIYINDLIQGLVQMIDKGRLGEIYILTSENPIKLCDVAKVIGKVLNKKIRFIPIPAWFMTFVATAIERIFSLIRKRPPVTKRNIQAIVTDRVYDISKAKKDLGFKPNISMEQGIINTVNYYIEKRLL